MTTRYSCTDSLTQACSIFGIDPRRVLRRSGLAEDSLERDELDLTTTAYFDLWNALEAEANQPDFVLKLALSYAHGPFVAPVFAFSCAETLHLGLDRLRVFKPLLGPMRMTVTRTPEALELEKSSADPRYPIPASMALFESLYIIECARTFTATRITPLVVELPGPVSSGPDIHAMTGGVPRVTGRSRIHFAPQDADLPLITRSAALWDTVEPMLQQQLADKAARETMAHRVRQVLYEALPGGASSLADVARRMNLSTRSLQRRLAEEGASFQTVLGDTRAELSSRYLRESNLSVPQISHLLGFRDTSSFFRAFQGWTGKTPGEYRDATG